MDNDEKPIVKLIGADGNAFAIINACRRAGRKAGFSQEKLSKMVEEMMSGDYNNVLVTAMNYFEVL